MIDQSNSTNFYVQSWAIWNDWINNEPNQPPTRPTNRTSIHHPFEGHMGGLQPCPADIGWEAGHTQHISKPTYRDKQPVTLTFTPLDNSESQIDLSTICMSFDFGWKQENLQKTITVMGRKCKLPTEKMQRGTFMVTVWNMASPTCCSVMKFIPQRILTLNIRKGYCNTKIPYTISNFSMTTLLIHKKHTSAKFEATRGCYSVLWYLFHLLGVKSDWSSKRRTLKELWFYRLK